MLQEYRRQWTDQQRYRIKWVVWINILVQVVFPISGAFTSSVMAANSPSVAQESHPLDNLRTKQGDDTERWLAGAASRAAGMLKNGNVVDSVKNQLHGLAVSETNQALQNWLQRYGTVKVQANVDKRGHLEGSQFDMLLPLYDTKRQMAFTQFGLRRIDSRTTANFGLGQRHFLDNSMFGYNAFLDHDITRDHTRLGIGAEYARDFMKFGANGYFRASNWKAGKKLQDYDERPANGFDLRAEGYLPSYPQLGGKLVYEQYFGNEVGLLSEEHRQKNPSVFTVGASYTPIPLVTLGVDRKQSAQGKGETLLNFGLNYELGTPWSKQIDPDAMAFKRTLQGGRYDLVDRNNQIVLEYRKKDLIRLMMEDRIRGYGGEVLPLDINVSSKYGLKEIVWDTARLAAAGGKLEKLDTPEQTEKLAVQPVNGNAHQLFKSVVVQQVRGGTRYVLTLPPYYSKGNNTYILSGIAYDNQGNASERAETQIQVIALAVDLKNSGFETPNQSMVADGKAQTVFRLKLSDKDGKPISGAANHITLTPEFSGLKGEGKNPELGAEIKEVSEGSGIYEVIATAGTKHGVWKITPTVDGQKLKPSTINFGASLEALIDPKNSQLKVIGGEELALGESSLLVLELMDKDSNPITGATDSLSLDVNTHGLHGAGKELEMSQAQEVPPGSGHYEWKVTGGEKKGSVTVTPTANGKKLEHSVTLTIGESLANIVDTENKGFVPENKELAADGKQQTILTLNLKDKNGNPITNAVGSIKLTGSELGGSGTNPVIGKVKEEPEGSGTYKVNVMAGTNTGAWEATTTVDGNPLKNKTRIQFDAINAPTVSDLTVTGIMEQGQKLNATYQFNANGGNDTDHSFFAWGEENTTANKVTSLAEAKHIETLSSVHTNADGLMLSGNVKDKGTVLEYTISPTAVGKVLELSVLAANAVQVVHFPPETVTLSKGALGNKTTGGNSEGGVSDPNAGPVITRLTLSGDLEVEKHLTATYQFDSHGGNDTDSSKYMWHDKDVVVTDDQLISVPTDSKDSKAKTGTLMRDLKKEDAGKILAISVKPINGENIAGLLRTVDTGMNEQDGNKTSTPKGGKQGSIFDPEGKPAISELKLEGILEKGKTLTAKYIFEAGTGDITDKSGYTWCRKQLDGTPDGTDCKIGTGPDRAEQISEVDYFLEANDVHRIIEFSIQAENARGVKADDIKMISSGMKWEEGNHSGGGTPQGGAIDPDKDPVITDLKMIGPLVIGKKITATYTFDDNNGHLDDNSLYVWGIHEPGEDDPTIQAIETSNDVIDKKDHVPESFELTDKHAGKIIALAVRPKNGKGKIGGLVRAQGMVLGIAEALDVTWNVSTEQDLGNGKKAPKVRREEPMILTIKTLKDGSIIRGVPIKIELGKAIGRDKTDLVDPTAQFEITGKAYKNGDTYTGYTDQNGELMITVTDKSSIGLKTPVLITVNEGTGVNTETKTQDVIFTVLTSPDTDKANYWGHMPEEVNDGKNTFYRPRLVTETKYKIYIDGNNEYWSMLTWGEASDYCQNKLNASLPTVMEALGLATLNLEEANYSLYTHYGWPANHINDPRFPIWTSANFSPNLAEVVLLNIGQAHFASVPRQFLMVCRK
ncbi:inverse autotransporter beta domain-containing protein [Xenorhabdus khoisanae]|uniref:inverse autotransporter beta domain-containing protein n=1 Tax=Xenorhabdus khoisanae TaxID=880157 RepID=UPI00235A3800|nr:inverse autotransporter beta domain-containing protein [Xenorhabdus khoisanae]MDC9615522.1 inverse autotransporter beta domain-containing protein [Xenorhabdus khoisanae]